MDTSFFPVPAVPIVAIIFMAVVFRFGDAWRVGGAKYAAPMILLWLGTILLCLYIWFTDTLTFPRSTLNALSDGAIFLLVVAGAWTAWIYFRNKGQRH